MNAKKIKARMIIMGLTQKNIAEVWGCATATVSQKLTGYRPISLNEANLLAEKLNLTDKEYYEYFFATNIA
jgi:transcriptional regulator with XRE-family HTH domain|nr:helix-turn-helix transcriptional regulator [Dialister invisus]DAO04557.1 MAG TPA: Regulatory protein [Caudoviricetes sp.]